MHRTTICPKCKGKVYIDRDVYGWYIECLGCGYTRDLKVLKLEKEKDKEVKHMPPSNTFGS